ncbi:MAG: biotin/lipoyl-containing protein [Dehalococcoidia bacterium]|nr:biotin/lipoyl-containing protein [Dehalococcoidia bacterium]
MKREIRVKVRGKWHTVEVDEPQRYPFHVTVDGEVMEVEVERQTGASTPPEDRPKPAGPAGPVGLSAITQQDQKIVRSPMPGRIVSVSLKVWDEVAPGAEICILETMKMEQSVRFSQKGTVRAVFIRPGQNVSVGEPLIQLD